MIVKSIPVILVILVILATLISCKEAIKEGEVYATEFHPSHVSIIMMPVVRTVGKSTSVSMVPIPFFYPDSWSVSFKAFDEKENKWRERTVYVSKEVFDVTAKGMWYETTDTDLSEQPRIKQNH